MRGFLLGAGALLFSIITVPAWALSKAEIKDAISTGASLTLGGQRIGAPKALAQVYAARDYEPIWITTEQAASLSQLRRALSTATQHGLDPADYHFEQLSLEPAPGAELAVELFATDAYLSFGAHLLSGRLNPVSIEPDWTAARRSLDLATHLLAAVGARAIYQSLVDLAPQQPGYQALSAALGHYRTIADAGGWPRIDSGPALKLGVEDTRVKQLRDRLLASGDLSTNEAASSLAFDARLEQAVKAFQRRANLDDDGVVGPRTLAELNRSAMDLGRVKTCVEMFVG